MITQPLWTGFEACVLRAALRMTIVEFARDLGVSERCVSNWEAKGTAIIPRPQFQAILDTALTKAGDEAHERFTHALATGGDDPTDRREFLRAGLGVGLGTADSRTVSQSSGSIPPAHTEQGSLSNDVMIGLNSVDQIYGDLRRIVTVYPERPVHPLHVELSALSDQVFRVLESPRFSGSIRDVHLIAGTVHGVLANASFDLGKMSDAYAQARTAFLCADIAGCSWLRSWIRGTQALIAYWEGRLNEALGLVENGYQYQPECGTALVRLAGIEARAFAQMGDRSRAQASLLRADRERDRVALRDNPGGMMEFPQAKQDYSSSTAWLWMGREGDLRHAERHAVEAVRGYTNSRAGQMRIGELCLARLDVAGARISAGDVEGAGDEIDKVLRVVEHRQITSVTTRLTQCENILATKELRNSRPAQELRQRIDFTTRSINRASNVTSEV
jgi:hypothetical protein